MQREGVEAHRSGRRRRTALDCGLPAAAAATQPPFARVRHRLMRARRHRAAITTTAATI
jgi:hypothetical protein